MMRDVNIFKVTLLTLQRTITTSNIIYKGHWLELRYYPFQFEFALSFVILVCLNKLNKLATVDTSNEYCQMPTHCTVVTAYVCQPSSRPYTKSHFKLKYDIGLRCIILQKL